MELIMLIMGLLGGGLILAAILVLILGAKKIEKETLKCPFCEESFIVEYISEKGEKIYRLGSLNDYEAHFRNKHPSEVTPKERILLDTSIEIMKRKHQPSKTEIVETILSSPLLGGVEATTWGVKRQLERKRTRGAIIEFAENTIYDLFVRHPKEIEKSLKQAGLHKLLTETASKTIASKQREAETDPIKILKTRYASGEIGKKEYEEMKKTLEEN